MPKRKSLTDKQKMFCLLYTKYWNASLAARGAGYSEKTAGEIGYENLKKPEIQAEIQRILNKASMSAEEVLARLTAEASANMSEIVEPYEIPILDKEGQVVGNRQSFRLKPGALEKYGFLIKAIAPTRSGDYKFELYDAQKALELLGRHRNLFKETNLNIDLSKLSDAQLERIANGEDPLKVLTNA